MQNLILNNMQPKVQPHYEQANRSTRLGSRAAFGFGGFPPTTAFYAGPGRRAQLRPGLLLKVICLGGRRAADKSGKTRVNLDAFRPNQGMFGISMAPMTRRENRQPALPAAARV